MEGKKEDSHDPVIRTELAKYLAKFSNNLYSLYWSSRLIVTLNLYIWQYIIAPCRKGTEAETIDIHPPLSSLFINTFCRITSVSFYCDGQSGLSSHHCWFESFAIGARGYVA